MSQTNNLITSLKKRLRSKGITYSDIGNKLNLSEVSIKRMFSNNSFSLERLNIVCEMLEMDLVDLVRIFDDEQEKITRLSITQEEELVSDTKFLLVAICAQNTWTFQEIVDYYQLSEPECISYLIRLDRLGLIQLLPNNKIKRMVAQDFQWLSGGPIETFFENTIQNEFLHSPFTDSDEQRVYLSGTLSTKSISILNKKIEMLVNEFSELQNDDAKLPVSSRSGVGLLFAIRQWESTAFQNLKRVQ